MRAMVMTNIHAKCQGQKLLGSKVRVETDRLRRLHITSRANAASNNEYLAIIKLYRRAAQWYETDSTL